MIPLFVASSEGRKPWSVAVKLGSASPYTFVAGSASTVRTARPIVKVPAW